jgi:two-component system sensor kinase FixL
VVRLLLNPLIGPELVPYLTFFLAVVTAGALLGLRAGIVATVASAIVATFFFVPPHFGFLPMSANWLVTVLGFLGISAGMLIAIDRVGISRSRELEARESQIATEAREQRLIDAAHDFAIYELDRDGRILTWNKGAERLKGWKAEDIIGKPYNVLHTPESRAKNSPGRELKIAGETGRFEE